MVDAATERKQLRTAYSSHLLQGVQAQAAFGEVLKMKNAEPDDAQQYHLYILYTGASSIDDALRVMHRHSRSHTLSL